MWHHLDPYFLAKFVNVGMFKICSKVQKSLLFERAQLLRVSDLLLGTVIWGDSVFHQDGRSVDARLLI